MDAREYLDLLKDDDAIIRLAHYDRETCDGRGYGIIIDEDHQIAVMVTDCGDVRKSQIPRGAVVKFIHHPVGEPKIVGSPAYAHKFSMVVRDPSMGAVNINFE